MIMALATVPKYQKLKTNNKHGKRDMFSHSVSGVQVFIFNFEDHHYCGDTKNYSCIVGTQTLIPCVNRTLHTHRGYQSLVRRSMSLRSSS